MLTRGVVLSITELIYQYQAIQQIRGIVYYHSNELTNMEAKKFYRKLVKNGSSFALNIPKEWIEETEVESGDLYELIQKDGKLIIQKVIPTNTYGDEFLIALEVSYKQYEKALKELRDR